MFPAGQSASPAHVQAPLHVPGLQTKAVDPRQRSSDPRQRSADPRRAAAAAPAQVSALHLLHTPIAPRFSSDAAALQAFRAEPPGKAQCLYPRLIGHCQGHG